MEQRHILHPSAERPLREEHRRVDSTLPFSASRPLIACLTLKCVHFELFGIPIRNLGKCSATSIARCNGFFTPNPQTKHANHRAEHHGYKPKPAIVNMGSNWLRDAGESPYEIIFAPFVGWLIALLLVVCPCGESMGNRQKSAAFLKVLWTCFSTNFEPTRRDSYFWLFICRHFWNFARR
jgi:hypothetical protein